MSNCIIKYEYNDGVKLPKPIAWCGSINNSWKFTDAQHAILSIEQRSLITPCEKCLEAIRKVIAPA